MRGEEREVEGRLIESIRNIYNMLCVCLCLEYVWVGLGCLGLKKTEPTSFGQPSLSQIEANRNNSHQSCDIMR